MGRENAEDAELVKFRGERRRPTTEAQRHRVEHREEGNDREENAENAERAEKPRSGFR